MDAKLTLKLDSDVIDAAKAYAAERGRSLSSLVETFFRNLTLEKTKAKATAKRKEMELSPFVRSMMGVMSENTINELAKTDARARYILRIDR